MAHTCIVERVLRKRIEVDEAAIDEEPAKVSLVGHTRWFVVLPIIYKRSLMSETSTEIL